MSTFKKSARLLRRWLLLGGAAAALAGTVGCSWDAWGFLAPPTKNADSIINNDKGDNLVLRGDRLEPDLLITQGAGSDQLETAHQLYRQGEYRAAQKQFHKVANTKKNSQQVVEEALYFEAECLRRQGYYTYAADTYSKLLTDGPTGAYRDQAMQRLFDIANYWLDDTRREMAQYKEKLNGKRMMVWPSFVNIDKTKPFFDEEGRALEKLQQVRWSDMTGPLADKALFLAGSVKFYREDYSEADHYFFQLVEHHPESQFVHQALELGIISKHLSTGGSDYDGRKVAEARQLIDVALRNYPQLAQERSEFLDKQLAAVNLQQAEKDYKIGEFYRRTGHLGSAYFYYEIVRRRYPNTPFFDKATQRMFEIQKKLEKEGDARSLPVPPVEEEPAAPPRMPAIEPPGFRFQPGVPRSLPPGIDGRP